MDLCFRCTPTFPTAGDVFDGQGTLSFTDACGCAYFDTPSGQSFALGNDGGFAPGSIVNVRGDVMLLPQGCWNSCNGPILWDPLIWEPPALPFLPYPEITSAE